jgi:hypothetical protein
LIRRARHLLAAAGTVALLAGGMAMAGAGASSALTVPVCKTFPGTTVNCFTSVGTPGIGTIFQGGGVGGYYGADDGHTQFRYVQSVVTATPELVDLNGPAANIFPATTGVELCDPNNGVAIKLSLGFLDTTGTYRVAYQIGQFPVGVTMDPCIQTNFHTSGSIFHFGTLLGAFPITAGDQVFLSISYQSGAHHSHSVLFTACDSNNLACRQASHSVRSLSLYEFGIGTFTPANVLTGGAINFFQHFSSSYIACYSCAGPVHISQVQSVGPFGAGGLWEAQFANSSSQVTMSPNDTLGQPTGGSFSMYNGSTSI